MSLSGLGTVKVDMTGSSLRLRLEVHPGGGHLRGRPGRPV